MVSLKDKFKILLLKYSDRYITTTIISLYSIMLILSLIFDLTLNIDGDNINLTFGYLFLKFLKIEFVSFLFTSIWFLIFNKLELKRRYFRICKIKIDKITELTINL